MTETSLSKKKIICLLTPEFFPILCGGTIFTDKMALELTHLGYEVHVCTSGIGKNFIKEETRENYKVFRFFTRRQTTKGASYFEHILFLILGFPQLIKYALKYKPQLILSVFVIPTGFLGLIVGKILNIQTCVFVDAADTPGVDSSMKGLVKYLVFLFQWVTKKSDSVVILDGLQDLATPFVDNKIVKVIPNGTVIPPQKATPGKGRNQKPQRKIELLSIGRMVLRKGFQDILRALKSLKEVTSDFHLTIIGYGKEDAEIMKVLQETGLEEHVTFTGRVEYEDLKNYYLKSDAYIFYGKREGSSLAMIEAVAYGLPVFATNHPGNTTFVKDRVNGYLIDEAKVEDLKQALLHFLSLPEEQIEKMGQESQKIADSYSWAKIAESYTEVFTEQGLQP